jgi:hypothetical protein
MRFVEGDIRGTLIRLGPGTLPQVFAALCPGDVVQDVRGCLPTVGLLDVVLELRGLCWPTNGSLNSYRPPRAVHLKPERQAEGTDDLRGRSLPGPNRPGAVFGCSCPSRPPSSRT